MNVNIQAAPVGEMTEAGRGGPFLPERRTGTERLVFALVALGMIASFVGFLVYEQALKEQLKPDQLYNSNIVKPQLYYIAHGCQLVFMLAAGVITLVFTNFRAIERGYLLRLLLLFGAAMLMTVRGYSLSEFLSTRLVDATGPFPFLLAAVVFIGARNSNWKFLGRLMVITAVVFSVLTLVGIAGLRTFTRQEAVASIAGALNVLYWPASWIALRQYPRRSAASRMQFLPMIVYSFGSLFVQTRLNFVMVFALMGVYAYLQYRRNRRQALGWILAVVISLWCILFASIFVKNTRAFDRLSEVADAFSARMDDDTRTGQLVAFFDDIAPQELFLGRGSFATWNWGGVAWNGGTDVGYLSLLLYGGVPLLLAYFATHLLPGITVLRSRPNEIQLVAAGVVLLWIIRMFSSSYPGLSLEYFPLLFCVGACISRDPMHPARRLL